MNKMRWIAAAAVSLAVGCALTFSHGAYADVASLVGKKVQSEVSVFVNGKRIDSKAVVINNTTYLPARNINSLMGFSLALKNGNVQLTSKNKLGSLIADYLQQQELLNSYSSDYGTTQNEINLLYAQLESAKQLLGEYTSALSEVKALYKGDEAELEKSDFYTKRQAGINDVQGQIRDIEARLDTMKANLDKIDSLKAAVQKKLDGIVSQFKA